VWEYNVVTVALSKDFFGRPADESERLRAQLDELGAQGWELVSSFDTNYTKGGSAQIVFVLKRPRAS
jgi:hypothetical protein